MSHSLVSTHTVPATSCLCLFSVSYLICLVSCFSGHTRYDSCNSISYVLSYIWHSPFECPPVVFFLQLTDRKLFTLQQELFSMALKALTPSIAGGFCHIKMPLALCEGHLHQDAFAGKGLRSLCGTFSLTICKSSFGDTICTLFKSSLETIY